MHFAANLFSEREPDAMRFPHIVIALFATLSIAGYAVMQQEAIAQAYRTVNVRSGPGTEYDIIGQLNSGDQVPVTGRSDVESNWLRIQFEGAEGWVAYFTITPLGNVSNLPVVEPRAVQTTLPIPIPVTQTPVSPSTDTFITAFRRVNVRSGPGLEYRRIGVLEPGSTADIMSRTDDNQWMRIDFNDMEGWVAYFVISVTGELDDIPVEEVPTTAETREPPVVNITTRYNVNLRATPILGASILGVVPFRTTLQAEARYDADDTGTWLRVTYEDETGWLLSSLVIIEGRLNNVPLEITP